MYTSKVILTYTSDGRLQLIPQYRYIQNVCGVSLSSIWTAEEHWMASPGKYMYSGTIGASRGIRYEGCHTLASVTCRLIWYLFNVYLFYNVVTLYLHLENQRNKNTWNWGKLIEVLHHCAAIYCETVWLHQKKLKIGLAEWLASMKAWGADILVPI